MEENRDYLPFTSIISLQKNYFFKKNLNLFISNLARNIYSSRLYHCLTSYSL